MACRTLVLSLLVPAALSVPSMQHRNPGVGMQPSAITPFASYYMDGYSVVTCAKDYMHLHGDKHGDGKYEYKIGDVSNVSIVHYTEMIDKMDQEPMTYTVCYGFCRTVPGMLFFGITNGRDCYCTPYYKQIAGDSSSCDAPCDGDPTTMCGGKTKSTVFEMHACNNAGADLAKANNTANVSFAALSAVQSEVAGAGSDMQTAAATLQASFGQVGDTAATANLQAAKVFAGELEHAAEAGATASSVLSSLMSQALLGPKPDLQDTEALVANIAKATEQADASAKELTELAAKAVAPTTNKSTALYYSVMYFVDKAFVDVPSTCSGTPAASPLLGDLDGCAAACENEVGSCVAFSYFAAGGQPGAEGLCFLFSKLTTATYYTGCGGSATGGGSGKGGKFLQVLRKTGGNTTCMAKLSEFEGTSIKPDPSGKCDLCLKEAKQFDRCFA